MWILFSFSHFVIYLFLSLYLFSPLICLLTLPYDYYNSLATFYMSNKKSYQCMFWMHSESSCSVFSTAVPAPTDLGFGQVGPDSMEVTWVAPHVPNPADINSFLIRYKLSIVYFCFKCYLEYKLILVHPRVKNVTQWLDVVGVLIIQVSSHWRWRWQYWNQRRRQE